MVVYPTIRQHARVLYEQIVNDAQLSWLSLIDNEGKLSNCFSIDQLDGQKQNASLLPLFWIWKSIPFSLLVVHYRSGEPT